VSVLLVVVPLGFFDINDPSLRCGTLYRGGVEDGIHLLVLDEGVVCLTILWWEFSLHFNLRGLSRVKDELSEISLINQILEVSSEGPIVDGEMAHPVMEGTYSLDLNPFGFA